MDEFLKFIDIANRLSGSLVVVVVIVGGTKKFQIWMFKWVHDLVVQQLEEQLDEIRQDRDRWRDTAFMALGVTERIAGTKRDAGV